MRRLIAACVATFVPACELPAIGDCSASPEPIDADAELTEAQLDVIVQDEGLADRSAVRCEHACTFVLERDGGSTPDTIDTCELDLAPTATASAEIAATVRCAGTELLHSCAGRGAHGG